MKLHALFVAAALALGGAAFAQTGDMHGSAGAPTASPSGKTHAQVHHKKVAKGKKAHARHHASASRHEMQHRMHARADRERHDTHAMGAGAAGPRTDLDAHSRMERMDSAYQDWQRQQGRR